jgi:hypothetical protein
MDDQPEGKMEMSIRVLGNELFAFKMVVDDMKMKWVLIAVLAMVVMLWAVGQFGPMLQAIGT